MSRLGIFAHLASASVALCLVSCSGDEGPAGPDGPVGPAGVAGTPGAPGDPGASGDNCTAVDNQDGTYTLTCGTEVVTVTDGQGCTVADNGDGTKTVTCGTTTVVVSDGVDGVDAPIPVTPGIMTATVDSFVVTGGFATIDFTMLDENGDPVPGLAVPGSRPERSQYFRLAYAQLAPGAVATDANFWQPLTSGDRNIADLIDNGDGTYTYASTTDISASYDPTLMTRVLLLVATGPAITETYNAISEFPGTGATVTREVITNAACSNCHGRLERQNFPMHGGGSRYDVEACPVCHVTTLGDGEAYFPNMVHKIHSAQDFDLGDYSTLTYPQELNNCATCHKGSDEYWKTKPSQEACKSCHVNITFDNTPYTGIDGVVNGGQVHDATNDLCLVCHGPTGIFPIEVVHAISVSNDPIQRTISATISAVVINDGEAGETNDGTVVVSFTVRDGGTPVTDPADITGLEVLLSKLVPGTNGSSSHWQSYINKFRTKNTQPAVVQGYSETGSTGTLVSLGGGNWSYTFGLPEADVPGDIRTINNARDHTLGYAQLTPYSVPYEPALTHRVAMTFRDAAGVYNATNPYFDFVPVPDPAAPAITRDIVNMENCQKCHAGQRLHKGYDVKLCVNCHNQSTFDPYTGDDPQTVDLQRMVHKLHMGRNLPSVLAGGSYTVNSLPGGSHDFSEVSLPQSPANCLICHDESLDNGDAWQMKPTKRACGTCHDSEIALLHIEQNSVGGEACLVCHGPDRVAPVEIVHYGAE